MGEFPSEGANQCGLWRDGLGFVIGLCAPRGGCRCGLRALRVARHRSGGASESRSNEATRADEGRHRGEMKKPRGVEARAALELLRLRRNMGSNFSVPRAFAERVAEIFMLKKDVELPWVARLGRWAVLLFGVGYAALVLIEKAKEVL